MNTFLAQARQVAAKQQLAESVAFAKVIETQPVLFRDYAESLAGITEQQALVMHSKRMPAFEEVQEISSAPLSGTALQQLAQVRQQLQALQTIRCEHPFLVIAKAVAATHGFDEARSIQLVTAVMPRRALEYSHWLVKLTSYEASNYTE